MIGELKERIIIQQPTETEDGQGGFITSWEQFAGCWAKIEPLSANQVRFSSQLQHRVTHKITVRYSSTVNEDNLSTDMRISHGNKIYQVHSFRNAGLRNRVVEIMCEEGSAS